MQAVVNSEEGERDETEYLLSNPVNAEKLLSAIKNVENGKLITVAINSLKQLIEE